MHLILIRHSHTTVNPQVSSLLWGLSEEGMRRLEQFSRDEFVKSLDVIYTSLQTKALETAITLAKPNLCPIKTDQRLTEITSFTNAFIDNFDQSLHDFFVGKLERINDGESSEEALARFNTALADIVERERPKKIVGIVSHGIILSYFSAQYTQSPVEQIHTSIRMPDLSILDWETKEFMVSWGQFSAQHS
jgi:broad specificity phosphatase PhoE